jgi:hypothetical protein
VLGRSRPPRRFMPAWRVRRMAPYALIQANAR